MFRIVVKIYSKSIVNVLMKHTHSVFINIFARLMAYMLYATLY